jgi:hypothetical protein
MINLNSIPLKPVSVQVEREATEHNGGKNQHPVFPGHTVMLDASEDKIFEKPEQLL